MAKRHVEVELDFVGDGTIKEVRPNAFAGGVKEPKLGKRFGFNVLRETEETDEGQALLPIGGRLQVNIWGTTADYRALGRYFLGIAELDSRVDPGFHEHHDDLEGDGGGPRVNVISLRKTLAHSVRLPHHY